jgi:hypothetical protein
VVCGDQGLLFSDVLGLSSLGSVIFVSPLKSMNCTGLETDFEKTRSNDFKRLGKK